MSLDDLKIEDGKPLPLGAEVKAGGVNFAVFSRNATSVTLILFETADLSSGHRNIALTVPAHRTGDVWHCFVRGLRAGAAYAYRVDGPFRPDRGLRFNRHKVLLDPYAKALTDLSHWDFGKCSAYNPGKLDADLSFSYVDDIDNQPRCVVVDDNDFDWQGDKPLNYPLRFSVLYETHVKGLTMTDPAVRHGGTYAGVIEKIPFFKTLGVTSLEFLPIHEFYEWEFVRKNPKTGEKLGNYWGYSTVAFFAPKGSYAADKAPGASVREFKTMVRELHKAGIEVILDVVFNHTAEGNELGPTFSFRGFDNSIYYILNSNRRYYQNYSGCGNTLNCNNPILRNFIMDCLKYWVVEMHIDGFRFDLGSILGRDQLGNVMENPPTLEMIAEEPVLRNTKIIAEAWDAGGAYQVGWFPGGRWAEWNDRFRDDVRRFWRGDPDQVRHVATRISGSSDLYLRDGRKPFHSINFVTSHDGFTLNDLVSYARKHNEENGEGNRDGNDNNFSANYGCEGPAINDMIRNVRERQMKNLIATLMLSLGTPMLSGGDEFGRTQRGNNNAYCQDNETSWYDWKLLDKNAGFFRFTREMIAFRLRHASFMRPEFYLGRESSYRGTPDITWYAETGDATDWNKTDRCFAAHIEGMKADVERDRDVANFFLMFNASQKDTIFSVCPPPRGKKWFRAIDTNLASPEDIKLPGEEIALEYPQYTVKAQSLVVLLSR
ncbi:MAG: glycogen debranching protein GlgX [Spirochaetaceae bacterium]|jgi:glycogen operon protein|nr:glycogen debranching protein GlgX [Spirochaetaceae bacterium]